MPTQKPTPGETVRVLAYMDSEKAELERTIFDFIQTVTDDFRARTGISVASIRTSFHTANSVGAPFWKKTFLAETEVDLML